MRLKQEVIKKEQEEPDVLIKKELQDDERGGERPVPRAARGYARGSRAHYRFQVAFIESVVPSPWSVCWGALGSGIIGVKPSEESISSIPPEKDSTECPSTASNKPPDKDLTDNSAKVNSNQKGDLGWLEELIDGARASRTSSTNQVGGTNSEHPRPALVPEPDCNPGATVTSESSQTPADTKCKLLSSPLAAGGTSGRRSWRGSDAKSKMFQNYIELPPHATIILLINSKHFQVQSRNGKAFGDYGQDYLDLAGGTMRWSTQRRDRAGKILNTIARHAAGGSRIVVATRGSEGDHNFKALGEVQSVDDIRTTRFLVEDGDMVIQELGSKLHHKQIKPSCVDAGLRSGIGLLPYKFREERVFSGRWCINCCYEPGSALFRFKRLNADGIAAFVKNECLDETVKRELSTHLSIKVEPGTPERPWKRLRSKTPATEAFIKREHEPDADTGIPGDAVQSPEPS